VCVCVCVYVFTLNTHTHTHTHTHTNTHARNPPPLHTHTRHTHTHFPSLTHRATGATLPLTEVVPQPLVKPPTLNGRDTGISGYPAQVHAGAAEVRDGVWGGGGGGGGGGCGGGWGGTNESNGGEQYSCADEYGRVDVSGWDGGGGWGERGGGWRGDGGVGDGGGGGGGSGFEGLSDEVGVDPCVKTNNKDKNKIRDCRVRWGFGLC
jgi:hypothetical protein